MACLIYSYAIIASDLQISEIDNKMPEANSIQRLDISIITGEQELSSIWTEKQFHEADKSYVCLQLICCYSVVSLSVLSFNWLFTRIILITKLLIKIFEFLLKLQVHYCHRNRCCESSMNCSTNRVSWLENIWCSHCGQHSKRYGHWYYSGLMRLFDTPESMSYSR